jgi:hypothetical protein
VEPEQRPRRTKDSLTQGWISSGGCRGRRRRPSDK